MFRELYRMTSDETQFFLKENRSRFKELLNMGLDDSFYLSIEYTRNCFQNDDGYCRVLMDDTQDKKQSDLIDAKWIENRVRLIISIMQSEKALAKMFPSKIISQIIFLYSSSNYSQLIHLLRSLQKTVENNPKENLQFEQMIQRYEHKIALKNIDMDDGDGDYEEDEFKSLVYSPNRILPLSNLYLSTEIKDAVEWFCIRYQNRHKLKVEGLPWGNRILLAGPPGNGKTALAGALSQLLGLPIFIVNMGELRRSHIGETGHNMSILFQGFKHSSMLKDGAAIVFFDECDSVATNRIYEQGADKEDSASLNVLLTNLDQMNEEIIAIAATNAPEELDPAFKRRFSSYLWLAPPTLAEIQKYVDDYQKEHKVRFTERERKRISDLHGQSWAKVTEFCQNIHTARIIGTRKYMHQTDWLGKKEKKKQDIGFQRSDK